MKPNPPTNPRLVLRVGFAGRRELDVAQQERLSTSLTTVLQIIGHKLAALTVGIQVEAGKEPRVCEFYAKQPPVLRLTTGLCEGADAIAGDLINKIDVVPDTTEPQSTSTKCLHTELSAILPFDVLSYRSARQADFLPKFDEQLQKCAWVMELDGIYDKPKTDTKIAELRRHRAYRAQTSFLLRHSDILIAATNPNEHGKAGGTLETIHTAMKLKIPVIFIHTEKNGNNVYLIAPEKNFHSVFDQEALDSKEVGLKIGSWIEHIVADPDIAPNNQLREHAKAKKYGANLLTEYFGQSNDECFLERKYFMLWRGLAWNKFQNIFALGHKSSKDPELEPYSIYRKQATTKSYLYSGAYRGAFLFNYIMALGVVSFAAACLVVIGRVESTGSKTAGWLLLCASVLLGLTLAKLGLLALINYNTKTANRGDWNDKAVDFRYLAERLRAMYYLPLAGTQRPPTPTQQRFAARGMRQSAVDWLFGAIVRSISPAELGIAKSYDLDVPGNSTPLKIKKLIRLEPEQALKTIQVNWLMKQADYHKRNSNTMLKMLHTIENHAKTLGITVVVLVVIDLLVLIGKQSHLLPAQFAQIMEHFTPWIVMSTAILPAMVTTLNGIRYQSECQRLGERSTILWRRLNGHISREYSSTKPRLGGIAREAQELLDKIIEARHSSSETDLGSWSQNVLEFAEDLAEDLAQEAGDWSVIYSKEVADPPA